MSDTLQQLGLSPTEFSGQVVVVTGGGRGIGLETVKAFARLGARVAIAELADNGLAAEEAVRRSGGEAWFMRTDVSDPASVAALAQQVEKTLGPVEVLINNAIFIPVASVVDLSIEQWDRTQAVNLRGSFLTCKAFLPAMLARHRGVIVNMVSTDAMPGLAAYIASKQGIAGFSQTLAVEMADQGVKVIPFAPGMVDTPAIRGVADDLAPHLGLSKEQFLGLSLHPDYAGLMPAEDAAAATVYLAARLADEFNGQVVNGYEVLERAGFLKKPDVPQLEAHPPAPLLGSVLKTAPPEKDKVQLALARGKQLKEALGQTEAEFGKLPLFIRPMARAGFKSKAGQSLAEWGRRLDSLLELLASAGAAGSSGPELKGAAAQVADALPRLAEYYRGVPAETARFTKDRALLEEVARLTEERTEIIEKLEATLVGINEQG